MAGAKKLKVTLVKSTAKAIPNHKECVKGLGLRKTNHSVVVADTPCNRGMINKVIHLLSIEEV
jgi:large subunit ribosomal protein L30